MEEKIRALEEALPLIPDHKGTERMRAQLKTTLAKLKREAERRKTVKVRCSILAELRALTDAHDSSFSPSILSYG